MSIYFVCGGPMDGSTAKVPDDIDEGKCVKFFIAAKTYRPLERDILILEWKPSPEIQAERIVTYRLEGEKLVFVKMVRAKGAMM